MEHLGITLLALFVLAFGLVSRRLESTFLTGPMVFSAFGLVLGPIGLGWFDLDAESGLLHNLAEATLLLVLFADASVIDLRVLRRNFALPLRLLSAGLPLCMALGTWTAVLLFPELTVWHAALIAAILAPTDAALGQAVVSNEGVPGRIRQALNVESGLNDGICLPFVMMFLALAAGDRSHPGAYWADYAAAQLVLGPLAGIAVGYLGGKAIRRAVERSWMNHTFQRLSSLPLAMLSFCVAEAMGGNGFIAAFVAGMTYGNTAGTKACERSLEFAEAEGQLIGLPAFFAFGATSIAPALLDSGPNAILYAVLGLTLIRIVPVSLSLLGSGLGFGSYAFLGWFGPRGLASILYVLMAVENDSPANADLVFAVVISTVLLSVFAHGVTAAPGAVAYANLIERRRQARPVRSEDEPVEGLRAGRHFRG